MSHKKVDKSSENRYAAGMAARLRRRKNPWQPGPTSAERIAASQIVRAALYEHWPEADFYGYQLSPAVDAVLRHPTASDRQILDFIRWFTSDENPMP